MGKVIASITASVDGYVTGPDDGPEYGLGRGGERLHYWVMGGPWTYDGRALRSTRCRAPTRRSSSRWSRGIGGGIVGRGMYDAAGRVGRARTRSPAR